MTTESLHLQHNHSSTGWGGLAVRPCRSNAARPRIPWTGRIQTALWAVLFSLLIFSQGAQAAEPLLIDLKAYKITLGSDGEEKRERADQAKPGDLIEYVAVYLNNGDQPLRNLQPTLPIPNGLEFQGGSAKPAVSEASADGKTFSAPPLKRVVVAPAGTSRTEEIPPSVYRALRWSVPALPPGQSVLVRARARVQPAGEAVPAQAMAK